MNTAIENEILRVTIATKGAEVQSIFHKENKLEYLWNGNPAYWGKRSPVLFPIVGSLKKNEYEYGGKKFSLGRHGFARDMEFSLVQHKGDNVIFLLQSGEATLEKYPFHFNFFVQYSLQGNRVMITYFIENKTDGAMFFSVGAHPAFKLPLVGSTAFEDYYLLFSAVENANRWPLSSDGLIMNYSEPLLINTNEMKLFKSLFYKDALVLKHIDSKSISVKSDKTPHGITVYTDGFPYLGLWNAKDADFLCIEPWCGIADSVNASGKLEDKEGICHLEKNEKFEKAWSIELF